MASTWINETDVIEVSNPPVLIFGDPGAGTTSLANTAPNPVTLDFDTGAHRSGFRKKVVRFQMWEDVLADQRAGKFDPFDTIILDTVGTLLGYIIRTIMAANAKEEKDGDERKLRPDIAGGSYGIVMQSADIVGYLTHKNGQRFIGWDPTDQYFAKNGARLTSGPVPDFNTAPDFMAKLLVEAKANLGRTSAVSAEIAKAVESWRLLLAAAKDAADLHVLLKDVAKDLKPALKVQVWALFKERAKALGCVWDEKAKAFLPAEPPKPTEPTQPTPERQPGDEPAEAA
jgi:hypothetical protein